MRAAVLREPGRVVVEERALGDVGAGEIVVRVELCGICGSDVQVYRGERPDVALPRVLGHEFTGTVVAMQGRRQGLRLGDRVVVDADVPCGSCKYCEGGKWNVCPGRQTIGFALDGALAEYVVVPRSAKVYRVPERMTREQAVLVQPLSVGAHAVFERGVISRGERVLVLGAGAIGLGVAVMCKVAGARVLVADLVERRLRLAAELGADRTLEVGQGKLDDAVRDFSEGEGVDKVFECVGGGQDATLEDAIRAARPGGTVVVVGSFTWPRVSFPGRSFKDKEIELRGARGQGRGTELCLELFRRGVLVGVERMISHRYALSRIEEAFACAEEPGAGAVKVVVECEEA